MNKKWYELIADAAMAIALSATMATPSSASEIGSAAADAMRHKALLDLLHQVKPDERRMDNPQYRELLDEYVAVGNRLPEPAATAPVLPPNLVPENVRKYIDDAKARREGVNK